MTTESNFYNTIIVGAGMAGSSTAYHLLCENNYKGKVLILEARNRIGGRVNGMTIAGKHVELGMYERYLINDLKFESVIDELHRILLCKGISMHFS